MSTVKRECRVVMLPTQKASNIVLSRGLQGKPFFPVVNLERDDETLQKYINAGSIPQHLYILSNDKINIGDWYLNVYWGQFQVYKCNDSVLYEGENYKIIATTDVKLGTSEYSERYRESYFNPLPQPSQGFIQKFMEAYNDEKPIERVMVDYVKYPDGFDLEDGTQFSYSLKINYKDNTITINKIKDSWTREELPIDVLQRIVSFGNASPELMTTSFIEIYDKAKRWLEKNN